MAEISGNLLTIEYFPTYYEYAGGQIRIRLKNGESYDDVTNILVQYPISTFTDATLYLDGNGEVVLPITQLLKTLVANGMAGNNVTLCSVYENSTGNALTITANVVKGGLRMSRIDGNCTAPLRQTACAYTAGVDWYTTHYISVLRAGVQYRWGASDTTEKYVGFNGEVTQRTRWAQGSTTLQIKVGNTWEDVFTINVAPGANCCDSSHAIVQWTDEHGNPKVHYGRLVKTEKTITRQIDFNNADDIYMGNAFAKRACEYVYNVAIEFECDTDAEELWFDDLLTSTNITISGDYGSIFTIFQLYGGSAPQALCTDKGVTHTLQQGRRKMVFNFQLIKESNV